MTTRHTLQPSHLITTSQDNSRLWAWELLLALICVLQLGLANAANVDLLVVLDKNGTDYTLQQTISLDSPASSEDAPASENTEPLTVKITLESGIQDPDFLFLGPHQESYRDLYLKGSQPPTVISINSGSVIIRYRHSLQDKINPPENDTFAFLLSEASLNIVFSEDSQVEHSARLILPEELEFSYADDKPASDSAAHSRRTISIHTSEAEGFKVPIRYKRVDQDQDGIADSHDLCPDSSDAALVDRTGCEPDADIDGVTDIIDMCPGSTANALVDDKGCEPDTDNDGLADRYDQCDDTPADYPVGENGCNLDSDKDGVADAEDQCPDSEPFEPVSQLGCSLDFDDDGVPNFRDQCNATPFGRTVNLQGCELDTDADGIPDRLDVCTITPANIEVDSSGCAIDQDGDSVPDYRDICQTSPAVAQAASEVPTQSPSSQFGCVQSPDGSNGKTIAETENGQINNDDHIIVLGEIKFTTDSSLLSVTTRKILDTVAYAIKHHQPAKFEIAAHTDNVGESLYNLQLSQERADAVRQYLMVRGVSPNTITSRGYGELLPLNNNSNAKNREHNRRIEIRKLDE